MVEVIGTILFCRYESHYTDHIASSHALVLGEFGNANEPEVKNRDALIFWGRGSRFCGYFDGLVEIGGHYYGVFFLAWECEL